jgi:hypothetical protein
MTADFANFGIIFSYKLVLQVWMTLPFMALFIAADAVESRPAQDVGS